MRHNTTVNLMDNGRFETAENGDVIKRGAGGRFLPGTRPGPGNPSLARTCKTQDAFRRAVSDDDLCAIAKTLVKRAIRGNVPAAREILDRVLGKSATRLEMMMEQDKQELASVIRIEVVPCRSESEIASVMSPPQNQLPSLNSGGG